MGTVQPIEFLVFDNSVPAKNASIFRNVATTEPCESDQIYCDDLDVCSDIPCDVRALLLTTEVPSVPPVILVNPYIPVYRTLPYGVPEDVAEYFQADEDAYFVWATNSTLGPASPGTFPASLLTLGTCATTPPINPNQRYAN